MDDSSSPGCGALARRTVPVSPNGASKLTKREMEGCGCSPRVSSTKGSRAKLYITRQDRRHAHRERHAQLGVRSRSQAVALAYRDDLVKTIA